MEESMITIPGSALLALVIESLPRILLPFLLFHFWSKRTGAPYIPAFIGVGVFMVVIPMKNLLMKTIGPEDTPWVYYIMSASLAGIFEECGKYFAFRKLMYNRDDRKHCISYGIGHGAVECVVSGIVSSQNLIIALWINGGGQDDCAESLAASHPVLSLYFLLGSALTLLSHIAMSVVVFAAAHKPNGRKYLIAAIAGHTAMDILAAFMFTDKISGFDLFLLDLPITAATCYIAWLIYRELPSYDLPGGGESL